MTSRRASIEDPESGGDAEFERIKQNFRSTVVGPDVPANFSETQAAFQELQDELQEFLSQYIPKVASLQGIMSTNMSTVAHGATHENQLISRLNRTTRTSMLVRSPDAVAEPPETGVDGLTVTDHGLGPSRHSSVNRGRVPLDAHMHALQTFLSTHMEGIRALQASVYSTSADSHMKHNTSISPTKVMAVAPAEGEKYHDDIIQQFHAVVAISTTTAALIILLVIMAALILGGRRQTGFNIGMLFAFFALSFHFGNIIIGSRGANLIFHQSITHEKGKTEHDPAYFRFYLTICEQLQRVATLFLVVSVFIMAFLIFSSLAYPFLFLFLSAIGAIVVGLSAYFKVLITAENLLFLAKNSHRLGWRVLDYVKTNVNQRRYP